MRAAVRRGLERAAGRLARVGRALYQSPQEQRVEAWFRDRGDRTLRLDYELDGRSLVFDLGGFEGQWASDLFARYGCSIWVFEAAPEFSRAVVHRFAHNPRIRVFPFGLGERTKEMTLSLDGDASSGYMAGSTTTEARIIAASEFLSEHRVERIDLMKVNIEGAEYDLLDHLLETGWTSRIVDLQVQFHDFVPGAEARMRAIQRRLSATHELTWQYEFVWENWRRRGGA